MNGNAQKLIKYLDGASKRFIIPVYQRNYDWKMEHCKQLYDDLVKIIRQNRKSHFFGSIVSVQSESGTMEEFLIIDGQQRLTTISLLLLAIYHLLSSGKMVSRDHQLTDKILKKYLIDEYEPEEKRIKLKPIPKTSCTSLSVWRIQKPARPKMSGGTWIVESTLLSTLCHSILLPHG